MSETQPNTAQKGRGLAALGNASAAVPQATAAKRELLDTSGACQLLGIHRNTLYRLIQAGNIPALRFASGGHWRFRTRDLLDWLEARGAGRHR